MCREWLTSTTFKMQGSPSASVAPRTMGFSMVTSNSRPLAMSHRGLEVRMLSTAASSLPSLPFSPQLTFLIFAGFFHPTSACSGCMQFMS